MNCRYIKILLVLACVTALFSCSKEWRMEDARVAVMTLSPSDDGAATRSSINETEGTGKRKVTWSVADEIYWWTSPAVSGTPGDKRKYTVLADAESVEIPVSYNDNDQYVTFYTAGRGVGGGTTSDMTQLTFSVPQRQDGTFASNHVAVHKSKLILEASAASMKPVATMLRFTLSTLTYAGKTVDNIRIGCMDGSSRLWGDFKVTMDNASLGAVSSVDKIADAVADATPVIIDKRASAFQTGLPYYVAIRPNTVAWPQGLYFDLYNGGTKLGRVIVRDSATGGFTLSHGKIRDLGDLKTHVNIPTTVPQMTMYPPYAAFTKDIPSAGKKFWLRVEPEDFSGSITWSIDDETNFKITPGTTKENLTLDDGTVVSCWTVIVSPSSSIKSSSTYDRYVTKLTATAKVLGETDISKTVDIEMGKFVDLGCENAEGKRVLWTPGSVNGSYDSRHYFNRNDESEGYSTLVWSPWGGTYGRYYWGYVTNLREVSTAPAYGRWNEGVATPDGNGGAYTEALTELELVDDVAYRCMAAYVDQGETGWRLPTGTDAAVLISSCTWSWSRPKVTAKSKNIGFTDCYVNFYYDDKAVGVLAGTNYRLWCRNGMMTDVGRGIEFDITNIPPNIFQRSKSSWRVCSPVKYMEK